MQLFLLRDLLSREEDARTEFKLSYHLETKKLRDEAAKDLISLANAAGRSPTDYAHLVIGAGDKRDSLGKRPSCDVRRFNFSAPRFLDIVNDRCTPPLMLEYETIEANGNAYGVVTIPPSPYVHYLTKDLDTPQGFWRKHSVLTRIGDQIQVAAPQEIVKMEREKRLWADAPPSSVQLVDVSLDQSDSPYVQAQGETSHIYRDQLVRQKAYDFPTFDFKLQNAGSTTAFLHHLAIEVLNAQIDLSPVLSFRLDVERGGALRIDANNHGWGPARECTIHISDPTLNLVFGDGKECYQGEIISGGQTIFSLPYDVGRVREILERVETERRKKAIRIDKLARELEVKSQEVIKQLRDIGFSGRLTHSNSVDEVVADNIRELFGHPAVRPDINIAVTWRCRDANDQEHHGRDICTLPTRLITKEVPSRPPREQPEQIPISPASPMDSEVVFVSLISLDPTKIRNQVEYSISRKIAPGDVERFHVLVGSPMSCFLRLRFKILFGKSNSVESEIFDLHLWNPRNTQFELKYFDGDALSRRREQLAEALAAAERHGWLGDVLRYAKDLHACEKALAEYPIHAEVSLAGMSQPEPSFRTDNLKGAQPGHYLRRVLRGAVRRRLD